jgi:predicted  nucleic acid-binding Zn-ribbon protein
VIPGLIVVVLAVLVLAWVLIPLRQGTRRDPHPESADVDEAIAQKEAALDALVDIEHEREVGKLTDADFETLRAQYEAEALTALRSLNTSIVDANDELEAEIAAMKDRLRESCPSCGADRVRGRPCAACGSAAP